MATSASVIFGQLVIGAPGAGKTTYCEAMSRFLKGQEISKEIWCLQFFQNQPKNFCPIL